MTSQTVLVTGASSGIGRAAALALATRGHRVFAGARRIAALEALRIEALPHTIVPLVLDMNDPVTIARTVAAIDQDTQGRGVDVLVNNAGYATAGALLEMSDAILRAQFETNVFGLMTLTRAVLPAMMRRGKGRVVNVSSVSGRVPAPILGAYHATKYALEALSDALRMEVATFGVKVVLVEPGTVRTEFAARTMEEAQRAAHLGSRYTTVYARAKETEAKFASAASDPDPVVRAIVRAVTSRKPSARYVAPRMFYLLIVLMKLLPTGLVDAIQRKLFGLTKKALAMDGTSTSP